MLPAVAHKLKSDSGFRIGLAVVEAAVMVEHGPRVVVHGVVAHAVVVVWDVAKADGSRACRRCVGELEIASLTV